jgi:hypothetical protein
MKERPILFNGDMVRAILEGRKTQTRRIMKNQPHPDWEPSEYCELHKMVDGDFVLRNGSPVPIGWGVVNFEGDIGYISRLGKPGDQLWVRETWQGPLLSHEEMQADPDWFYQAQNQRYHDVAHCVYAADGGPAPEFVTTDDEWKQCWRPSIHMPRWASRIQLGITCVRVERLNEIGQGDACAEGCPALYEPIDWFRGRWESINGAGSWAENPWVWVIEFKVIKP